eukprot:10017840-Alexandrium_andersonii.AAC.1
MTPRPAQKGEPTAGERLASVRFGPERYPDLDRRAGLLLASGPHLRVPARNDPRTRTKERAYCSQHEARINFVRACGLPSSPPAGHLVEGPGGDRPFTAFWGSGHAKLPFLPPQPAGATE